MSRLIESIKLIDGKFCNLFYHEQRMLRSFQDLFGLEDDFHLEKFLTELDIPQKGLFKCRIVYDDVKMDVEFVPYQIKPVSSLKLVEHDRINYEYKYTDRKIFEKLCAKKEDCDDILIIKRDLVTDSSYANIVFKKGKQWFTPWSPLLKGTFRQKLIDENKVVPEEIKAEDIRSFDTFKLINALLEFDSPEIDVKNIFS
jgi:4-amino-4-deoxychorismate lyase